LGEKQQNRQGSVDDGSTLYNTTTDNNSRRPSASTNPPLHITLEANIKFDLSLTPETIAALVTVFHSLQPRETTTSSQNPAEQKRNKRPWYIQHWPVLVFLLIVGIMIEGQVLSHWDVTKAATTVIVKETCRRYVLGKG
jgi:hypothetical protein